MDGRTWGILILILIVLVVGYLLIGPAVSVPSDRTGGNTASTTKSYTIAYTDQGFAPANVTLPVGTTVTFVNQSSRQMWVASAPHPTHERYDGTTRAQHCAIGYTGPAPFDECVANDRFAFTFNKVGTWNYHNHIGTENGASITITETP